jgi:ABC-type transport system involved in multi-copper enzyme maturation permease subunit
MTILYWEIKKLLRQRQIYFGCGAALVFAVLGVLYHLGDPSYSAYRVPVTGIGNMTNTYFIVFPVAFCGFVFSNEDRLDTLKILAAKPLNRSRLAAVKLTTAVLYLFALMTVLYVFLMILGGLFFQPLELCGEGGEVIPAGNAAAAVARAYFFQTLACGFLVALTVMWTVLLRSTVLGFGGALVTLVLMILASNVGPLEQILPTARLAVWEHLLRAEPRYDSALRDLSNLGAYSLVFTGVSVTIWSTREIRN